jgi:hypothetical protein
MEDFMTCNVTYVCPLHLPIYLGALLLYGKLK